MAAMHYCALDGTSPSLAAHLPSTGGDGNAEGAWAAARELFEKEPARAIALLRRTPQTNEVARALPLWAGLLELSALMHLPMRVFEIGSSAGLNLRLDRFRYVGLRWAWGDPASRVVLNNRTLSGRPRHLDAPLSLTERRGCDVRPLDPHDRDDCLELLSFVWADQTDRVTRLRAAIELARENPADVDSADAVTWIRDRVHPLGGSVCVLMHSVTMEHMSKEARAALETTIVACAQRSKRTAPFAWLRMEYGGTAYETRLATYPGGRDEMLATSDGHAQGLRWFNRR